MPSAYLDTPASDGTDELSFTVGTFDATQLNSGKRYYTTIVATWGNTTYDSAKLQGQRGRRIPTGCYSEWCVFATATDRIINAWNKKLGYWPT